MSNSNLNKISVLRILIDSILAVWQKKEKFLKALALPTLLLVVIWATNWAFVSQSDSGSSDSLLTEVFTSWVVWSIYTAAFAIFAVACHRLILVEDQVVDVRLSFKLRELKFVGWLFAVYAIYFIISLVPTTVLMNSPIGGHLIESPDNFYYVQLLFAVPATYVLARLCLVFPATAIDRRLGLRWSWRSTRGNGWRIVIVIAIYPWVLSAVIWLVSREEAIVIERVLTALMYYAALVFEVVALSLTYKALIETEEEGAFGA